MLLPEATAEADTVTVLASGVVDAGGTPCVEASGTADDSAVVLASASEETLGSGSWNWDGTARISW